MGQEFLTRSLPRGLDLDDGARDCAGVRHMDREGGARFADELVVEPAPRTRNPIASQKCKQKSTEVVVSKGSQVSRL